MADDLAPDATCVAACAAPRPLTRRRRRRRIESSKAATNPRANYGQLPSGYKAIASGREATPATSFSLDGTASMSLATTATTATTTTNASLSPRGAKRAVESPVRTGRLRRGLLI